MQLGWLVGLDEAGRPLVTLATAGACEPQPARSTVARPADWDGVSPLSVLLHLEQAESARPIIIGFVKDSFEPAAGSGGTLLEMPFAPAGVTMDGKRLQLEATQEVVLKCGQGSITLQANGRVVIKGTELVSRASGVNKIRGATVAIN